MNHFLRLIKSSRWCIIALGLGLALGCEKGQSLAGTWQYEETNRFVSPDSKVDAVEMTGTAGATTRTHTYIFLVPHGAKVDADNDDPIFNADYVDKFEVHWKEPKFLEIHFNEAEIINFRNYWESRYLDDFHYVVEIMIYPQKEYSLPSAVKTW